MFGLCWHCDFGRDPDLPGLRISVPFRNYHLEVAGIPPARIDELLLVHVGDHHGDGGNWGNWKPESRPWENGERGIATISKKLG